MTRAESDGQPQHGQASIAAALERVESVLQKRPDFGRETSRSVTTLVEGLRCACEEGDWRVQTDLPAALGGGESGPTPGMLGRAALGSCLVMGYQLHASRLGVELTSIRVEIEADFDNGAMLFLESDARPGYSEVRYHVDIVSPAPDELVLKVLDEGDVLSPYRDVFAQPTPMQRSVSISRPAS
jgi:uncharacterized OsmC-like protein